MQYPPTNPAELFGQRHGPNTEALWYSSHPYPPTCRRLSRLPHRDQLGMGYRLALAIHDQDAGWRSRFMTATGERYWYWPQIQPDETVAEWWLVPPRTERLAARILSYAAQYARARTRSSRGDEVAMTRIYLLRLLRRAERAAAAAPEILPTRGNGRYGKRIDTIVGGLRPKFTWDRGRFRPETG